MKFDPSYEPTRPLPEDTTLDTLEYVAKGFSPSEVFSDHQLSVWAHANNYLTVNEFLEWYHMNQHLTLDEYFKSLNK